jgi:hypothetical protein
MKKIFSENLNILSEKYITPYFFIDKKYKKNNFLFPNIEEDINLKNIDVLYIYKITNKLNEKILFWLENKNKKIIFLEDDIDKFHFFLYQKNAKNFLLNNKIDFLYLLEEKYLNEIIYKNPSNLIDIISFDKKNKKFEEIKEKIIKKNISSFYQVHNAIYSFKHFKNFFKNLDLLPESFLANDLKNSFDKFSAIILGAGPSLKYSFEKINKLKNKALIIACGSSISFLTKNNILPHLAILIDPNYDEFLRVQDSLLFEVPILYSTRVNYGIFSALNANKGYLKASIGGFFEAFIDEKLNIKGEYIGEELDEKALSVTSIGLSFAKYLGCKNIILDGVDLAYSENKLYAQDVKQDKKLDLDPFEKKILDISKNNKKIYTNHKWQLEKICFSNFAKNNKDINFINCSKDGLNIDNFLNISLDEVESKYLTSSLDVSSYLQLLIENSKLKISKKEIENIKCDIKDSFEKSISFLKILNNSKKEYEKILALSDLEEEIAYRYFLIEAFDVFNRSYENKKYEKLLDLANEFLKSI